MKHDMESIRSEISRMIEARKVLRRKLLDYAQSTMPKKISVNKAAQRMVEYDLDRILMSIEKHEQIMTVMGITRKMKRGG